MRARGSGNLGPVTERDNLPVLVERWAAGDLEAFDRVVELLYDDLRRIAHRHLTRERDEHTLSTTALVHEAYIELSKRTGPAWRGRPQFFALVSKVMRHLLIDYARRRNAERRGGQELHVPLDEGRIGATTREVELLTLDDALNQLEEHDERMARIVECRFFGGMKHKEIGEALGVSTRTVEREWRRARAYLFTMLEHESTPHETGS